MTLGPTPVFDKAFSHTYIVIPEIHRGEGRDNCGYLRMGYPIFLRHILRGVMGRLIPSDSCSLNDIRYCLVQVCKVSRKMIDKFLDYNVRLGSFFCSKGHTRVRIISQILRYRCFVSESNGTTSVLLRRL